MNYFRVGASTVAIILMECFINGEIIEEIDIMPKDALLVEFSNICQIFYLFSV
jgi:hypothetical protein